MLRTGLILKKIATSRIFDEKGVSIPTTILQLQGLEIVDQRTKEKDGYTAVCLGAGTQKQQRVNAAMRGYLKKQGIEEPKAKICECRVSEDCLLPIKTKLSVDHFVEGQYVDVQAKSIGKGFAGVMKRHNFSGLRASHGVSVSHRSAGSTGHCQDPGRVFKGKKMAGQMGAVQRTKMNLRVVRVDEKNNLLLVLGSVPGPRNSWVLVRDAVKKPLHPALISAKQQPAAEGKE